MSKVDEICSQVGDRLRKARNAKRLSQLEVAKAMNVAQSQYGKVETGKVVPGLKTLIRAAEVLEIGIDELLYGIKREAGLKIEDAELLEKFSIISKLNPEDKLIAKQLIDLILAKKTLKELTISLHGKK